jgi:hypothetical protein
MELPAGVDHPVDILDKNWHPDILKLNKSPMDSSKPAIIGSKNYLKD